MKRYARQTILDEIGIEGQQKLLDSKVCIVGCGGLGSIAAPYLAGAGVGKLILIDADSPDESNLHRQVFYHTDASQESKAHHLAEHISKLNPETEIEIVASMIDKGNIDSILDKDAIVLECTDHILTKYLVNDYCHIHGIPLVYGAIHKYDGYLSFFENFSSDSIHLRDIFPIPNEEIPTCSEVGVMGTLAGMIGLLQANEAIKYIVGAGKTLKDVLLSYNILNNEQFKLKLIKNYISDMHFLYNNENYKGCVNVNFDITLKDLKEASENFTVISILEDKEHENIGSEIIRMPLSSFETKALEYIDQPIVFYCMSGKRSTALVNRLKVDGFNKKMYSLKGGLNGLKKRSD